MVSARVFVAHSGSEDAFSAPELVRSINSDVQQLRLSIRVEAGKELLFRLTAMERDIVSQRRLSIMLTFPLW